MDFYDDIREDLQTPERRINFLRGPYGKSYIAMLLCEEVQRRVSGVAKRLEGCVEEDTIKY